MNTYLGVLVPVAVLMVALGVVIGGAMGKALVVVGAILAGVDVVLHLMGRV